MPLKVYRSYFLIFKNQADVRCWVCVPSAEETALLFGTYVDVLEILSDSLLQIVHLFLCLFNNAFSWSRDDYATGWTTEEPLLDSWQEQEILLSGVQPGSGTYSVYC